MRLTDKERKKITDEAAELSRESGTGDSKSFKSAVGRILDKYGIPFGSSERNQLFKDICRQAQSRSVAVQREKRNRAVLEEIQISIPFTPPSTR